MTQSTDPRQPHVLLEQCPIHPGEGHFHNSEGHCAVGGMMSKVEARQKLEAIKPELQPSNYSELSAAIEVATWLPETFERHGRTSRQSFPFDNGIVELIVIDLTLEEAFAFMVSGKLPS